MRTLLVCLCLFTVDTACRGANFDTSLGNLTVGGYFNRFCVSCHGPQIQEGEFRIDTLSKDVGRKDTALWAEVRERISSGEMPPETQTDRPTAKTSADVVAWLSREIESGEAARMAARDPISFYRLSRDEYVNTVRDLLAVEFDATDPGGFSDDPQWHGFQRIGTVLSLSASHIEKYLQAAEVILDEAYPDKAVEPVEIEKPAVPPNTVSEPFRSQLETEGLLDAVRFDLWPQDKHRYASPGRLPAAGVYEVEIKLSGLKPPHGRAPRLKVYHPKLDRVLFTRNVVTPEDDPTTVRFRTHLPEGSHQIIVTNDVPGPSNLPRSGRHGRRPFVSIARGRTPWQLKLTDEQGEALYPFLILDKTTWRGPIVSPGQQTLRDSYMPGEDADDAAIREALSRFATAAFRRPAEPHEVQRYADLVANQRSLGASLRAAMKTGMLAILCSDDFLFLVEGDRHRDAAEVNDWELASRLSYCLWATMPDDALWKDARQGRLHRDDVLAGHVRRMLDDPRADRFIDAFATQWLRLQKVGMFAPDANLYPDYDGHLEQSMIGETRAYLREVIRGGHTLRELIDSDWTMVNPRLAEFYGFTVGPQDRFEKVSLVPNDHRGGLLTQAAILSLTSDGTRQRPVHRGVWISECILGQSPPPPPANVEPIEPNPIDAPKATIRMKLEAHQSHPHCFACHRKIDPLGFAFENYDAIGRWRTSERVGQGTGVDPVVDASGELDDGRAFADVTEFKRLLLDDLDAFHHTFIEKLATFALRRAVTFEDQDEIRAIARHASEADYNVRTVIETLLLSDLFRRR